LISMAHSLGLKVIAEGVEEQQQLDQLDEFYCDEIQGFLLSKPISSDDFMEFLQKPQYCKSSSNRVITLHS
ncbi:MAG: EAL domain-containing protein, partial [bacterium]|nr:EAL domain-containing protein [bacterium]